MEYEPIWLRIIHTSLRTDDEFDVSKEAGWADHHQMRIIEISR